MLSIEEETKGSRLKRRSYRFFLNVKSKSKTNSLSSVHFLSSHTYLFKILLKEFGVGFSIAEASNELNLSFSIAHCSAERALGKIANPFSSISPSNSPVKIVSKCTEQNPSSIFFLIKLLRVIPKGSVKLEDHAE